MVDDDRELCELVREYLKPDGLHVELEHDGEVGLFRAQSGAFELVILDVMLPTRDGLEVLSHLRRVSPVPVIMLTARGDEDDRIKGLELGADDYLPKPFNPRELLARVRSVLRRQDHRPGDVGAAPLTVALGDLTVCASAMRATRDGQPLTLTAAEVGLLEVLLQAAGRPVTRDELAERVLGRPLAAMDRSIDVHMSNLRRKLGPHPGGSERIRAIRGVGYLYTALGDPT
jgi:DNA-binding response OmpR family regulator